jgi:hypothetical protein
MPPRAPLLRIPYTDPLPAPRIIPTSANTASGAVAALVEFLAGPPASALSSTSSSAAPAASPAAPIANHAGIHGGGGRGSSNTLLLTGAGISVASGLADYRGTAGTYTLNRSYRPIYFGEFCENHEARKRYWARSFLGWPTMERARPNAAHEAVGRLGELGYVREVVTQSTFRLPTYRTYVIICPTAHSPCPD